MGVEKPLLHAGPRSAAQRCAPGGAMTRSINRNNRSSRLDRELDQFPPSVNFDDLSLHKFADRSAFLRYSVAVLAMIVAIAARFALAPVIGTQFPFLTFFVALVFAAWFGGLGPSLLALGMSLVSIPLLFNPLGSLAIRGLEAQVAFGIFVPLGLTIALMGGSMRAAQLRAEKSEGLARKEEAALRASEQRFRTMADSAPVLIWVSGTEQRCTYFNRAWLEFTGRTIHQEVGEGWAAGLHPDDLARTLEIRAAASKTGSLSMSFIDYVARTASTAGCSKAVCPGSRMIADSGGTSARVLT